MSTTANARIEAVWCHENDADVARGAVDRIAIDSTKLIIHE